MKNSLLIVLCFFSLVSVNAQRRGGAPPGEQGGQQRGMPEFNASNVVGIFKYDDVLVVKKLKVKKDSDKNNIKIAISKYNREMDELALFYKDSLDAVNTLVNTVARSAMQNDDREIMQNVRRVTQSKMRPVREAVKNNEIVLNELMEAILDEKQFEKWLKYQKEKKQALNPRQRQDDDRGNARQNGDGAQGGGGQRRR